MAGLSGETVNMGDYHRVQDIRIEGSELRLEVDGQVVRRPLTQLSPRLAQASAAELARFEVSPSGYGIHWPLLDEDISIDGLLDRPHAPSAWEKAA
jgi:hypothetical protein